MRTKIEWTNETWNPTTGCTKVSEACRNCYAERVAVRFWGGRKFTDVRFHDDRLEKPLRWRKPRHVFVNSMSDLFHDDVPDEFIAAVFGVMAAAHQHTFQVLTKRPERMVAWFKWLEEAAEQTADMSREPVTNLWRCHVAVSCARNYGADIRGCHVRWPLHNVWLGVSAEDQKTADERVIPLLQTPAAVRFVSVEPMLGDINFHSLSDGSWYDREGANRYDALTGTAWWSPTGDHGVSGGPKLDWVICGGESGPGARPMNPNWARSLRDQCESARVPFFFKQWGEWRAQYTMSWLEPQHIERHLWPDGASSERVGKKAAGRELDGHTWDQFPGMEAADE